MSAVGLLFGLGLIAFSSTGVALDPVRRGIVRWRGPGFPLRKSVDPIPEGHQLELVTRTTKSHLGGVTITTHTLSFAYDDERLVIVGLSNRNEARRQAELVAKALGVDLHEDDEGTRRTISLTDLDESLRCRLLRGKKIKRPWPTEHVPDYQCEGNVGTIELPIPPLDGKPLLPYVAIISLVFLWWLKRGTAANAPFFAGFAVFLVLFGAGWQYAINKHRTRPRREAATIVASPEGLKLTLRGMLRTREMSFDIEELEDLDVAQVGNKGSYALLARSDAQAVMLGAGLDKAALEWTREAIAYHLTR